MVNSIKPPPLDIGDLTLIKLLVSERQNGPNKNFFNGIQAKWKTRVQDYINNKGNPELISPWFNEQCLTEVSKTFQNLYKSPSQHSVQKPILDKLRNQGLNYCPSCGESGTPNTLDHYLPKSTYPEFSVTIANLCPMCDKCQTEKRDKTLNNVLQRLFLHPYFDEFLKLQVLTLTISPPYENPKSFELLPHSQLSPEQQELVGRHIYELKIGKRFSHFFRDEYMRLKKLTKAIRDNRQNVIEQITIFSNHHRNKSINSWDHIFYDGVLQNADLMSYLENSKEIQNVQ